MVELRSVACRLCGYEISVLPEEIGDDLMSECSAHSETYADAESDPDMPT